MIKKLNSSFKLIRFRRLFYFADYLTSFRSSNRRTKSSTRRTSEAF